MIDDIVTCEHPDCDVEELDEVAGRDPMGTLWIWWVCQTHIEWAEDQLEQKRNEVSV